MTFGSNLLALLAASIVSVPVPPGVPSTDITAHHGAIYQTDKAGQPTAGFMDIENAGAADSLTAADCPIADSTTLVDANSQPMANVVIPPRRNFSLTPTGPHLLLRSTHYSVQYGGIIPCSLTFANAGTISIFLYAEPAPGGA